MNEEKVIRLTEYEKLNNIFLPEEIAASLKNKYSAAVQVQHTAGDNKYTLRAGSIVGAFRCNNYLFKISPKVELPVIWEWLATAYDLSTVRWSETEVSYETDFGDLEWIVKFFLHECKRIYSRGIKKGYVTEESPLPAVRGQLHAEKTFKRWLKHDYQFDCRYDELTENVKENFLITCALMDMLKRGYGDSSVPRDLRELKNIFGREIDGRSLKSSPEPDEQVRNINLLPVTRLNAHYKPAFQWALLYWKATALTFELGGQKSSSFLLDMNELFEMYIGKKLVQELSKHGVEVTLQKHDSLAEGGKIKIIPDVIIKSRDGREVILDLKYISRRDDSSINSNVFQMLAYLTARQTEHGILLYAGGRERTDQIKNSPFTIHQWSLQLDRGLDKEEINIKVNDIIKRIIKLLSYH
ncbi:McrC family protein [Evansella clarkii]|uniref:McrC family protein n=1 Tax=Evansella clarkii TaxID=79879 RepID=UPI0009981B24|nr:hypothetical protein [Evansella clarkii]